MHSHFAEFHINQCKHIFEHIVEHAYLKAAFALAVCSYAYLFNDGKVLIPVFSLVIIDALTGVMRACKQKQLSSRGYLRSLIKFIVYLCMIAVGGIFDKEFPGEYATATIKSFLMVTEAISIMENISQMGWPVPTKFLEFLKVFSEKDKNDKDNNRHISQ